jgi:cathepsin B
MKTLLVATLLAAAQANVHEYWAEHNYICNLCELSVGFVVGGGDMEDFLASKDGAGREFSTVFSKVRNAQNGILAMSAESGMNTHQICEELNLCGDWVDEEFEKQHVWDPELIKSINDDPASTWRAGLPMQFEGMTLADIRRTRLGTIVDPDHVYNLAEKKADNREVALPTDFSSITAWPYCAAIIGHIRDQSSCGSCWAFGSTESFNDRVCISNVTSGIMTQLVSVEDTTACCKGAACGGSNGCGGGQPTAAWQWFGTAGCPSGGDYDDRGKADTCEPYSLPPCAHHVTNASYTPCPTREYPTPACVSKCSNTQYAKSWSADKHYSARSYSLHSVDAIMQDLVDFGSVSAAFTVYQDFLTYKSGVYSHKTGSSLGGHAIKIIGYGVSNGVQYWLCNNSWNNSWGDNGFFKIKKGTNECGIERSVASGNPKS